MARDQRIRDLIQHAYDNAPAVRARFDEHSLQPSDIQSEADLANVPILPKDSIIALQQADPPFGGMLGVPLSKVRHIFMSPGPIYEPDAGEEEDASSVTQSALSQAGFEPGDVVINALSYHLVPAGMLLDGALAGMGCTVVPTGPGNTELQIKIMQDLNVTAYVGTPSFLISLLKKAEEMGLNTKSDLKLTKALVSAEPLFPEQRSLLVDTYGLTICNAYATAELGVLAINLDGSRPMKLMADPIIQVVDPETGQHVGPGEAGEVVVTNYSKAYPLIRLGTGDMAIYMNENPDANQQEMAAIMLVGRSGEASKVRGMFVHPNQLRFAVAAVTGQSGGASAVQGIVSRPNDKDHFLVKIALNDSTAETGSLVEPLHAAIQQACRVRANEIEFVSSDDLSAADSAMVDARDWG